ncbi:MAG: hypothetical protein MZV63_30075 [Marinilabiliales bacterium]|nr:hypothetical protein [Marinilabiliales bacterium]
MPPELAAMLADERIIKAGVAIHDDIKALRSLVPFEPGGFVDLQTVVADHGIKQLGLKKLSAIILGYSISKSQQTSNWEAPALTEPQQTLCSHRCMDMQAYYTMHLTDKISHQPATIRRCHARIILKKGKDQSVRRYHPWIFSGAIATIKGSPAEGDTVEVYASDEYLPGNGSLVAGLNSCKDLLVHTVRT